MSFKRGNGLPGVGFRNDLPLDYNPSKTYPEVVLPIQSKANEFEQKSIAQFLTLRDELRDGPLYTGSQKTKGRVVVEVEQSINDGIKRYSDKYIKKRKIGRSVDEHPYVITFFPSELHPAMGIASDGKRKKKLDVSKFTEALLKAERQVIEESIAEEEKAQVTTAKGRSLLSRMAAVGEENDDDNEVSEEEPDENFSEEDEDDDDYNAEKYFENGDADEYEGGGDDGEAHY
ncbi:DNA-directed RNA polymerase III subunit RPC7 [Trichomonascus vanleenenianus]|uniref:DNA-directed RNA polymerase III subunit C31 n=1 Tax=Trichomonascus vanleenenianus TaxID=2268995 RepID=UPI003ECAC98D